MDQLELETEIFKLMDHRKALGMANIAHLSHADRVKAMEQYRIDINEIDRRLLELGGQRRAA